SKHEDFAFQNRLGSARVAELQAQDSFLFPELHEPLYAAPTQTLGLAEELPAFLKSDSSDLEAQGQSFLAPLSTPFAEQIASLISTATLLKSRCQLSVFLDRLASA